jgi:hypothetical protein
MMRLKILDRDNATCRHCNSKEKTLHVHHMYYTMDESGEWLKPWEYPKDSLITLCEDCHKEIKSYEWKEAFAELNVPPFDLIWIAVLLKFCYKRRSESYKAYSMYSYLKSLLLSSEDLSVHGDEFKETVDEIANQYISGE